MASKITGHKFSHVTQQMLDKHAKKNAKRTKFKGKGVSHSKEATSKMATSENVRKKEQVSLGDRIVVALKNAKDYFQIVWFTLCLKVSSNDDSIREIKRDIEDARDRIKSRDNHLRYAETEDNLRRRVEELDYALEHGDFKDIAAATGECIKGAGRTIVSGTKALLS